MLALPLIKRPMSVQEIRNLQLRVANAKADPSTYFWGGLNQENLLDSVINYPLHSINVRPNMQNEQVFYKDNILMLLEKEYSYFLLKEQEFFKRMSQISSKTVPISYPAHIGDDMGNKKYLEQSKHFLKNLLNNSPEYDIINTLMTNQQIFFGRVEGVYGRQYIDANGGSSKGLTQKQINYEKELLTDKTMRKIFKSGKDGKGLVYYNKNYFKTMIAEIDKIIDATLIDNIMKSLQDEFPQLLALIGGKTGRREGFHFSQKAQKEFLKWERTVLFEKVMIAVKNQFKDNPDIIEKIKGEITNRGFSLTTQIGITQLNLGDNGKSQQVEEIISKYSDVIRSYLTVGKQRWDKSDVQAEFRSQLYKYCQNDTDKIVKLLTQRDENSIKGLLGELAGALMPILIADGKMRYLVQSLIIGARRGGQDNEELSVDVIMKVGSSQFGLQVKRYSEKTIGKSRVNKGAWNFGSTSALARYLGDADTRFLQFLEANKGFFAETSQYTGIDNNDALEIEYNLLYSHFASFMRIQQEDLDESIGMDILKAHSNFYLVRTELIPASYFLYSVYKEIVAAYKFSSVKQVFEIEGQTMKTPTVNRMTVNENGEVQKKSSIPISEAIKHTDNKIIFKGINLGKLSF